VQPNVITAPRIHRLDGDSAYDATQCDDEIRDGDVLVIAGAGVVGFLFKAWPVALRGDHEAVGFHTLADDADITRLDARPARTDTYWIHPRTYIVNGEEFDSKIAAEDAAREARTIVAYRDEKPYEHTSTRPADPGTDYSASVALAATVSL
jgi:hypothetical protein